MWIPVNITSFNRVSLFINVLHVQVHNNNHEPHQHDSDDTSLVVSNVSTLLFINSHNTGGENSHDNIKKFILMKHSQVGLEKT